jgi:hypothetical protein
LLVNHRMAYSYRTEADRTLAEESHFGQSPSPVLFKDEYAGLHDTGSGATTRLPSESSTPSGTSRNYPANMDSVNDLNQLLKVLSDQRRVIHDYEFGVKKKQTQVEGVQNAILRFNEYMNATRERILRDLAYLCHRVDEMQGREASISELKVRSVDTDKRIACIRSELKQGLLALIELRKRVALLQTYSSLIRERDELEASLRTLTLAPDFAHALANDSVGDVVLSPYTSAGSDMNSVCIRLLGARKQYWHHMRSLSSLSDEVLALEESNRREALRQIEDEMHIENALTREEASKVYSEDPNRLEYILESKREDISLAQQRKDRESIESIRKQLDQGIANYSEP